MYNEDFIFFDTSKEQYVFDATCVFDTIQVYTPCKKLIPW